MKAKLKPEKSYTADFSKEETVRWLKETWEEKAKPYFDKFYAALEKKTVIPPDYFSRFEHGSACWNPIFRFLRPETVLSILQCLKDLAGADSKGLKEAESIWSSILHPYIAGWVTAFEKLMHYYGEEVVLEAREAFNNLRYNSIIFRESHPRRLPSGAFPRCDFRVEMGKYEVAFGDFCKAFSKLPSKSLLATKGDIANSTRRISHQIPNLSASTGDRLPIEESYRKLLRGHRLTAFRKRQIETTVTYSQNKYIYFIDKKKGLRKCDQPTNTATINQLCAQSWNAHKTEWLKHATMSGDKKGFATLADLRRYIYANRLKLPLGKEAYEKIKAHKEEMMYTSSR